MNLKKEMSAAIFGELKIGIYSTLSDMWRDIFKWRNEAIKTISTFIKNQSIEEK